MGRELRPSERTIARMLRFIRGQQGAQHSHSTMCYATQLLAISSSSFPSACAVEARDDVNPLTSAYAAGVRNSVKTAARPNPPTMTQPIASRASAPGPLPKIKRQTRHHGADQRHRNGAQPGLRGLNRGLDHAAGPDRAAGWQTRPAGCRSWPSPRSAPAPRSGCRC